MPGPDLSSDQALDLSREVLSLLGEIEASPTSAAVQEAAATRVMDYKPEADRTTDQPRRATEVGSYIARPLTPIEALTEIVETLLHRAEELPDVVDVTAKRLGVTPQELVFRVDPTSTAAIDEATTQPVPGSELTLSAEEREAVQNTVLEIRRLLRGSD